MKLKIILLNLFAILLGGCCKNCIVHEKVNYPKSTRSGVKYINDKANLSRLAWWKKLKDPELNELISQALACNHSIRSSYATIEQAQAQLKAAQYAWIPTLDATASGFTGSTWNTHLTPRGQLANNPFFSNFSHPKFRGYYAGFVPGYTLNILNNINNVKAAKASLAIEQAQTQSIKLGIISQMSGAYFMLLSQREQLAVEKSLTSDLQKLRQLEHTRFQKGANDIAIITNVDQQIAQEEATIPQIERVIAQSENTIHLLLNQNPGPIAAHRSLLSLNLNHLIPKSLPSSVLKNRPDIMIALNNLKMAQAQIGVAYSAFFPSIDLTGLVGGASVDLTNILKLSTNIWIAQAAGSTKIFNARSYQNIKSAKAGFKAIYYDYLETLHSVFADVDDSLTNEQKNNLAYLQTQKAYLAAQKAYDIALAQYKAGAKDYRNVINAKINRDRSKLSLIQEKAQLLDSIVQVYNAVAGGYDAT
ncbi:TolC family protein [Legionella parisiensis]|uniref:Outer membrane protein OprM n=1 Tax=Legionella parisiensis TaxID=45071 RepID=A0A1E5JQE5_9GAMM|nr:TolC family protein [Legionella parisiensis]KTD40251.1 outer membrane efflux protein [Legionella parisiensis]OEH46741.1 Outer membrane protein OprM [Legionella parisiensis]STX77637.1 outer membrane efflux protein [Legionella parisiensis]